MQQDRQTSIFKKSLVDFLCILLISGVIFLIAPLKFIGPEFVNCATSKNCTFIKTAQWKWFGAYHIFAEPVRGGDQATHNSKYTLTSDMQLLATAVSSLIISGGTYVVSVKLKVRHKFSDA
ncbi:MAG TPA: hypothetical protein VLG92_06095 [Candidatus Saccharimonadia bacterium]|nr:hypothetical protein [Candidatus Saccharimonadia bacterium]